jgi:hypothetical protein
MLDPNIDLGQAVQRRVDPAGQLGHVVGVVLVPRPTALVRWANDTATFEPLEDLVGVTA